MFIENKFLSKMKYFSQIFYQIICLIGCMYQTYKISELYFGYQTTTDVKYELEATVTLPAITLCMNKASALKQDFIQNYYQKKSNNQDIKKYLNTLSIRDQIANMKAPEDLFTCSIHNNS